MATIFVILDFFLTFILVPFFIGSLPLISIVVKNRYVVFSDSKLEFKVGLSIVICTMLLLYSVYEVWSILFGPASHIDYGPGIVHALAVAFVPLMQLIISVPLAIWANRKKI